MINKIKQVGHSGGNGRLASDRGRYVSPCVFSTTEILLESDLLGASIWYSTNIESFGQAMKGLYFEDDDIVTDDNHWLD